MKLITSILALMVVVSPSFGGENKEEQEKMNPVDQAKAYIETLSIDKEQAAWKTKLPKFKALDYSGGEKISWQLKTSEGDITVKFLPEVAPNHVSNFIYLTELGFFDGLKFHRVITQFMAQGGDPLGTGTGSPGYRFDGEYSPDVKHNKPGLLSMANAGPGTDGSQFFLTFVATPWLDGKHTIFGETVEGMETLKALEAKGSRSGATTAALSIVSAKIVVE